MMLMPFADHVWQSSIVVLAVMALALLLRDARAQVRHWLWLAASLKFLVPFAALVALGGQLSWFLGAVSIPRFAAPAAHVIAQPFSQSVLTFPVIEPAPVGAARDFNVLSAVVLVVWGAGALAVAFTWIVRWRRVVSFVRDGSSVVTGRELQLLRALERRAGVRREMPMVISPMSMEPGVFGILRPVLLWPAGISAQLNDRQIEAILAHELAHVRRYDNLKAALHMLVQTVFWFHPLVWWLGARLVEEREWACDEDVLRLGSDPETYAAGILETCRFQIESPLTCVSGVTGADLRKRIEQIMEHRSVGRLSVRSKVLLAGVAVAAVAGPILAGTLLSGTGDLRIEAAPSAAGPAPHVMGPTLHEYSLLAWLRRAVSGEPPASAQAPAASQPTEFEVASVKLNTSGTSNMTLGLQPGGRFTAVNMPVRELVRFAYGIQMFQLEGGPNWMESARFDITAKAADGVQLTPAPMGQPGPINRMVRALLADRFKLVIEPSTREMSIYELVLARADRKLGPKLEVSTTDCSSAGRAFGLPADDRGDAIGRRAGAPPGPPPAPARGATVRITGAPGERVPCGTIMGPGNIAGDSTTMAQLAQMLGTRVSRIVTDRTGLEGKYSFTLEFTPDQLPAGRGEPPPGAPPLPPIDPNGPSIFTALQEQLGLKLESKRGPAETLVIKRIELPTSD